MSNILYDYFFNEESNNKAVLKGTDYEISYSELLSKSRIIAASINRRGYYKAPIIVIMNESLGLFYLLIGIIISGNYIILIDSHSPSSRMNYIIDNFDNPLVIVDAIESLDININKLEILSYEQLIDINEIDCEIKDTEERDYFSIVFTSGTTGEPKGVIINNKALIDRVNSMTMNSSLFADKVFVTSSFCSILSISTFFCVFKSKGTIINIFSKTPAIIGRQISKLQPCVIVGTPSWMQILIQYGLAKLFDFNTVNSICFAGENLDVNLVALVKKEFVNVKIYNWYGATELAGVVVGTEICDKYIDAKMIPLGQSNPGVEINIRNKNYEIVDDEIGELCVRTEGLFSGYVNNTNETEKKIVLHDYKGVKQYEYRTGDLVRCINQVLYYVGRIDNQIKHKGYRIELEDIENTVKSINMVESATAIYCNERIIVYYVGNIDENYLFEKANEKLPIYMRPYQYIKVQEMPLNTNGKVDRQKLEENYLIITEAR